MTVSTGIRVRLFGCGQRWPGSNNHGDFMNATIDQIPGERIALRIPAAAALSGLSRSTLYNLINAGKLRGVKVGGRRLILRQDLVALIQNSVIA
jgi:excisionase family DNA binding protein